MRNLFGVLYFVLRYIIHTIVRVMWNFLVTSGRIIEYSSKHISVFILKIVWNGLINIIVALRFAKKKIIGFTGSLKQALSAFVCQPSFQHYIALACGIGFLFSAWIWIDNYLPDNDKLGILAVELENSFILNELNSRSFESISFYVNPLDVTAPEKVTQAVTVEKQFLDEIGLMSFFEISNKTNYIIESEKIETAEENPPVDVKEAPSAQDEYSPAKKADLTDDQLEPVETKLLPDENPVVEYSDKNVANEKESLGITEKIETEPEIRSDGETPENEQSAKSVDIDRDKLKETLKYADSIEKRKKDAYMLFLKGRIEAERGNSQTAIEILERAKHDDPREPELLYYLGICYCRLGEYEKGVENLEASYNLAIDPNILVPVKNAYFMLGLKQAKSRDYDSASKSFSRAIEIDPDDGRSFFNRGICYIAFENYEQALSDLNNAEAKGFTCIELLLNRAVALEKTGETQKAVSEYKNILNEQPLYAPAHYNIATLLEDKVIRTGEYDRYAGDAIYHYKRALELDKGFYEASFNISRIYYAMGDVSMSIKWLKKCIELNNNFPEAHLFLAKLYLEKGAYNNALAQVELMEKLGYDFKELNQMRKEIFQICGIKEGDNE